MPAARRSLETILALILVLVFFSAFLSILNTVFPSGPGLRDLMRSQGKSTSPPDGSPAAGGPVERAFHRASTWSPTFLCCRRGRRHG